MMGSATRVCPADVSLNLADNENCVSTPSTPQMQPDAEASLDLNLDDSMLMMPSPAGPVFVNPSMELIPQTGNEFEGEDSLQTNLDIMYLETFGNMNMTHASQLAEIAQIEDELKMQQQIQVENEFKNADHLQNGVQLQSIAFNFETENDGLDNEQRDLFEEIDMEVQSQPPPISIDTPPEDNIEESTTTKESEDDIHTNQVLVTESEFPHDHPTPSSPPVTLTIETKDDEETPKSPEVETEIPMEVEIQLDIESAASLSQSIEEIIEKQKSGSEDPPAEVVLDVCEVEDSECNTNRTVEKPVDDIVPESYQENEKCESAKTEIEKLLETDSPIIETERKKTKGKIKEPKLIDINAMKLLIANRKLNKPYRVPLVPKYIHEGLDQDDELLRAFNARQDESMTCICVLCYGWFEDKLALSTHMMEAHRDNTSLEKCKICDKTFFARFLRLRHEKIHKYDMKHHHSLYYPSVDKPFDYLVPNHFFKRFKYAPFTREYTQKIKALTKELEDVTYECCDCGKIFKGEEPLRDHYERYHAVQVCAICKEYFIDLKTLRKHEEEEHDLSVEDHNYQGGAWRLWKHWEVEKMEEMKTIIANIDFMHTYAYREEETEEVGIETKDIIARTIERQLGMKTTCFKRPFSVEEGQGATPVNPKRMKQSIRRSISETDIKIEGDSQSHPITTPTNVSESIPNAQAQMQGDSNSSKCEMCNEQFANSEEMILHIQKSHTHERPYKCQFCGRGFATHSNRKEHERIHTGERPYVCIFCSRGFIQISNLKKHMQTHKDKNNLQCKTCGKQFVKESSLILHQRAHAVDRKFKCAHCDKAYNYSSLLKRHERIHTGEMPYSCDICMMPFHELVSLTYHRKKVHTGERPHKCSTCGRAFILSSDLKKHMKVHVKDNKEEDGEASDGSDSDSIDSLLRKELLEDGNNLVKPKIRRVRTYEPNKTGAAASVNEEYSNNSTTTNSSERSNSVDTNTSDPPVEVYELFEDELGLEGINEADPKINLRRRKSITSFKKNENEINSSNNDTGRDTTVVWVENGDDSADGKFIVVDDDGNEIDGNSIEICEVYDN